MSRNDAHLDDLLGRLCDGGLNDKESEQLATLLRDPDAQDRYAEYFLLHEALRAELSPGGRLPVGNVVSLQKAAPAKKIRRWVWAPVGITLAAAAVVLFVATRDGREQQGIAVVTRMASARFGPGSMPVQEGALLMAGPLVLEAGLVQLDLYSGATLVLEGPAALDLIDARSARFHHGRIRSRVPEPAKGLKISLPGGDVVDLGTEFGLDVRPQGPAEIHVFDGAVQWHRAGQITTLTQGQGLRLGDGANQPIAADDRSFVDPGRMGGAAAADVERRRHRFDQQRERLSRDPAVLLSFDFQDTGTWGRAIHNHAAAAWKAPDGAIVGCRLVAGRFPGKSALDFKRPSDRVLVNIPGNHDSFSIAAWVRFDGLDNQFNAFIHTDSWKTGDVHTHIQPSGSIVLDLHGRERLESTRRIGRDDLGRYIHLAWVWDAGARTASLYIDGRLDASRSISSTGPVHFGSAQIGNWAANHRNLNGQLDEFVILGRALSASEVAALAE